MTEINNIELNNIDVEQLDNLIIGRVEPRIYAFTTHTIPNYLKVGDTYRPIQTRLNEWRKFFPSLEKTFEEVAKVDTKLTPHLHAYSVANANQNIFW